MHCIPICDCASYNWICYLLLSVIVVFGGFLSLVHQELRYDGNTAGGTSSPAYPALIIADPLSITIARQESSSDMVKTYKNCNCVNVRKFKIFVMHKNQTSINKYNVGKTHIYII